MSLRFTYFEPMQSFSPVTSFTIVTIAVLGGSDDVPGPLLRRHFWSHYQKCFQRAATELYMIILGVLLVSFVLFAPEGIYGKLRSRNRGAAQ